MSDWWKDKALRIDSNPFRDRMKIDNAMVEKYGVTCSRHIGRPYQKWCTAEQKSAELLMSLMENNDRGVVPPYDVRMAASWIGTSVENLQSIVDEYGLSDQFYTPSKLRSSFEYDVYNWLIQYVDENDIVVADRSVLPQNHEIDILIPSMNIGIECDGIAWHTEFGPGARGRSYHKWKTENANRAGIRLFHLTEFEWYDKPEITQSMLLNAIGQTQNRVYARKCRVIEIDNKQAHAFHDGNHVDGHGPAVRYNAALVHDDTIVMVISVAKSRYGSDHDYEIMRVSSVLNTNVVGGLSKLWKHCSGNLFNKGDRVICYQNRSFGGVPSPGYTGLFGEPTRKTDAGWHAVRLSDFKRYHRSKVMKHKLVKELGIADPEKHNSVDLMKQAGYDRLWNSGNWVFETVIAE